MHAAAARSRIGRIGRYEIIREVGRGAMSTVYEAADARDGRLVAVKMLAPPRRLTEEEADELFARMRREAKVVARLDLPNVVRVLDSGTDREEPGLVLPYLVMELVEGETLAQRLDREGGLPPAAAGDLLDQIAAPLDAVHAAGVVHRDVKPGNIMLTRGGAAKLMDFGVARLQGETVITRTGALIGSPAYMSPEHWRRGGRPRPPPTSGRWPPCSTRRSRAGPPSGGRTYPPPSTRSSTASPNPCRTSRRR